MVKTWNQNGPGLWSVNTNWTPPGVPGQADDVVFDDATGSGSCTIDDQVSVKSIHITANYTNIITQQDSGIFIGSPNPGFFLCEGGTFIGGSARIFVNGPYTLDGTDFTSTSDVLIFCVRMWHFCQAALIIIMGGLSCPMF